MTMFPNYHSYKACVVAIEPLPDEFVKSENSSSYVSQQDDAWSNAIIA